MSRMSSKWIGLAAAVAFMAISGARAQTAAPATPDATMATPDASAAPAAPKPKMAKPKPKPKTDATMAEKPKPKAKKLPFVTVTVTNKRAVGLAELTATISGGAGDSVKVAGPLAPGKKAVAHLAHEKDCLFDLHGVYDDGATTDVDGLDVCKDRAINLTE